MSSGSRPTTPTPWPDRSRPAERVELDNVGLFSDGTAVKLVGEETFRLTSEYVDEIIRVDTDEVCAAIKDVFTDTRAILEPAGALAIAGAKAYVERTGRRGETLVAVACGANMNFDRLAVRGRASRDRRAARGDLRGDDPGARGSFRRFIELIGTDRSITEFNYRIADADAAHVFVGVQVASSGEAEELAEAFRAAGLDTLDLTDDELAKLHIRHLVGRSVTARTRRAALPVRVPRAAGRADPVPLEHGAGLEHLAVPLPQPRLRRRPGTRRDAGARRATTTRSSEFLAQLGYGYWDETDHPAYRLFLA